MNKLRIILAISLTILSIVTLAFFGYNFIDRSAQNMHILLADLERSIQNDNWVRAEKNSIILTNTWQQRQRYILLMKDHGELHDLDITLTRIKTLIKMKNSETLLTEIAVARKLVSNIREQEKFSPGNIF